MKNKCTMLKTDYVFLNEYEHNLISNFIYGNATNYSG